MHRRFVRGALLSFVIVVAGCPKSDPAPPPPPLATLSVAPATLAVAPGDAPVTFTATLAHSTEAVTWSVLAGTCASTGTIEPATGLYTPPASNDVACSLKVRATAGALTADAAVSLSARTAGGDTLSVTPTSGSVRAGSDMVLTVYVDASDAVTAPGCVLSPAVGACVEAASPGGHTHAFEITAPSTLVKGATPVEATITVAPLSAKVAVTVEPSALVVSGPSTVRAGGAIATYWVGAPDVSGETVAWSVQPAIGTIEPSGIYTPPETQVASTFEVVAAIGDARGTLTVTLLPPSNAGTASAGFLELVAATEVKLAECLGSSGFTDGEMEAAATSLQAAVDAGKVTYHPLLQQDCLESIDATTCLQLLRDADPTACIEDAYSGNVAEGVQCGDSIECAAGYCSFAAGTCPGACAAPIAAGGTCDDDEQCQDGLLCLSSKCQAQTVVGDGQTCNGTTYVCTPWSYCKSGLCVVKEGLGDACSGTGDCATTLICNSRTNTCASYAASGQPCGATAACNPFTDYCGSGETCVPWPVLGESCAVAGGCAGEAWCDASLTDPTCVALPGTGDDCWDAGECAGEAWCDAGAATPVCVATQTSGECWLASTCATGYYCSGNFMTPGSCLPLVAAGGACDAAVWDDPCQPGLDCHGGICSVATCY